jgi:hypothetical protein
MAADTRPDVDELFARMFGGTGAPGANANKEPEGGAVPPHKASHGTDDSPVQEAPAEAEAAGETVPVQEPGEHEAGQKRKAQQKAPKGKPLQPVFTEGSDTPQMFYRGQAVNKRGRVRASFWLTPKVLDALETRSFREKCQGKAGEKSEIVEAAMRLYLKEELNTELGDLFASEP